MAAPRTARYIADYGGNFSAVLAAIPNAAVAERWPELLAAAEACIWARGRCASKPWQTHWRQGRAGGWLAGRCGCIRRPPSSGTAALRPDVSSPADQRPEFAVTFTAALLEVHRPCPEYGLEADELDGALGFGDEPTVQRLRAAASALGQRLWLRIAGPAGRDAGEPIVGLDVVVRWTSVLPDEVAMARLRALSGELDSEAQHGAGGARLRRSSSSSTSRAMSHSPRPMQIEWPAGR